jgi:hypothetical protein
VKNFTLQKDSQHDELKEDAAVRPGRAEHFQQGLCPVDAEWKSAEDCSGGLPEDGYTMFVELVSDVFEPGTQKCGQSR